MTVLEGFCWMPMTCRPYRMLVPDCCQFLYRAPAHGETETAVQLLVFATKEIPAAVLAPLTLSPAERSDISSRAVKRLPPVLSLRTWAGMLSRVMLTPDQTTPLYVKGALKVSGVPGEITTQ